MKPTEAQQKVLDSKEDRVLVSASAGSGKTSTLIEKVALLLESGVSLDEMLIVTFTDSASQEMKGRLNDKLKELVQTNSSLSGELDALVSSDISTLHSFCAKLLRQYFYKVDLKANFSVMNDERANFLKSVAMEKTLKHYALSLDADFISLSQMFGRKSQSKLKSFVFTLSSFFESILDVDSFIDKTLSSAYNSDLNANSACQYINIYATKETGNIVKGLKELELTAGQMNATLNSEILSQMILGLSCVKAQNNFMTNKKNLSLVPLPSLISRKSCPEDSSFKEEYNEQFTALKDRIKSLLNHYRVTASDEEISQEILLSSKYVAKLIEVERTFDRLYKEEKSKYNSLDFSDLEKLTINLLSDKEVTENIDKKYIFLDEYQDINPLQEEIISRLAKEDTKIIMVGDVKQSIYAFRNSSPDIIKEKTKQYTLDNNKGQLIYLNDNFRSNPTILAFVNSIFEKVMDLDFGGADYSLSMLKSDVVYEAKSSMPIVEVDCIDLSVNTAEDYKYDKVYSVLNDKNDYADKLTSSRAQAMVIAKRIIDLVMGDNYIYDPKTRQNKKVEFSDIAILCRDNKTVSDIANVLMEYKLPLSTIATTNIYESIEVGVLLSFLRLVYSTHDDVSFACAITSQIGGMSYDDLVIIRNKFQDGTPLHVAIKKYAQECDDVISSKIKDFLSFIDKLRDNLSYMSVGELVEYIARSGGYLDYVLSLPGGSNRLNVLNQFMQSFEGKEYNYDLPSYLDYVDNFAGEKNSKMTFFTGENCVKISTIHASKGLEYPIVFLTECEKNFFKGKPSQFLLDPDLTVAFNILDETNGVKLDNFVKDAILVKKHSREREEELRLLYVALTRAKNHLFVLASLDKDDLTKVLDISSPRESSSYMPWVLNSLSRVSLMKFINAGEVQTTLASGTIKYNSFGMEDFDLKQKGDISLDYLKSDNRDSDLEDILSYQMPPSHEIALKNSVSAILQSNEDYLESKNSFPKRLSIYENESGSEFASRLGTAYHKFMEQVDFNRIFDKSVFDGIISSIDIDEDLKEHIQFSYIKNCYDTINSLSAKSCQKEVSFISYINYNDIFPSHVQEKVLVQGVADLIVDSGDKKYLVDYKTNLIENADSLVDKYKIQLSLYKMCLEKALNTHFDAVFIYSFYKNKLLKVF